MQLIHELTQYPEMERIFSLIHEEEDAVFLDSSLQNDLGQYSIIGLHPYLKLVKGEQFTVNGKASSESFESFLKRYLKEHQEENHTSLPLVSGAIGYFSYDYGRKKEGVHSRHPLETDIPDSILIFYDSFLIESHEKKRLYLIANDHGQSCESGMQQMERLVARAGELQSDFLNSGRRQGDTLQSDSRDSDRQKAGTLQCDLLNSGRQQGDTLQSDFPDSDRQKAGMTEFQTLPGTVSANFTRQEYMDAVQKMIQYIVEGDIYIANMTQQLQIASDMPPYEMFRSLRRKNPSPFGGYFNYGDFQVVCASPERFLQMRKRQVQTRPIKGTRKRGSTPEEDAALRLELEQSSKDQSELLMIVDLERNDLNRVCVPGSVKVTELFTVEAYATVFHLISNIVGILRPGLTVMDLMEAAFPGGSITGAPKLRAMEVIDELEHSRRNLYTGSMGYLSLDGDCDFNIVIRTALWHNGIYHLGVGGGITCESETEFEYEETLQKAKALLEALNITAMPEF